MCLLASHSILYAITPHFLPADRTSASPLSTAAIIGIAVSGTVILVVVLLLAVTLLLGWKYLHSKQTAEELIQ